MFLKKSNPQNKIQQAGNALLPIVDAINRIPDYTKELILKAQKQNKYPEHPGLEFHEQKAIRAYPETKTWFELSLTERHKVASKTKIGSKWRSTTNLSENHELTRRISPSMSMDDNVHASHGGYSTETPLKFFLKIYHPIHRD